jgi:hypothetical protein
VVGWLLLLLITYGVTVEAVHSHGTIARGSSNVSAVSDTKGSNPSENGSQHRECVICQFQQQLFNGVIHTPALTSVQSTQTAFVSTLKVQYLSITPIRPSGRAPPLG